MKDYLKILSVDEHSTTPKHVQISNAFLLAIENGIAIEGDVLPSPHDLGEAKNTPISSIDRVYKALMMKGMISLFLGSGAGNEFHVANITTRKAPKIIVLFNMLSGPKKIILDEFINHLIGSCSIDFYIYNNELRPFKKIITNALKEEYAKFVIISAFEDDDQRAYKIINSIPKEKLLLIDKLDTHVEGNFAAVYEDFEKDIYEGLEMLNEPLSKYSTIKLLYPDDTYYPKGILEGFSKYCIDYAFEYGIFTDIETEVVKKNVVYICLGEDDLILFVDKVLVSDFKIGIDIGVISYNETPVKKIIVNGITTISTDLKRMGNLAAEMILNDTHERVVIPSSVIKRNSL